MTAATNNFTKLSAVDCKGLVEKKGKFTYLSWSFAVEKLLEQFPAATWEVKRFDGLPFLKTELGYFVEVAVNVDGVTRSQIHPVLNMANAPIAKPNAFEINKSIARCLTKAIALHGLGIYIYNGEDFPDSEDGGGNGGEDAGKTTDAEGEGKVRTPQRKSAEKNNPDALPPSKPASKGLIKQVVDLAEANGKVAVLDDYLKKKNVTRDTLTELQAKALLSALEKSGQREPGEEG